MLVNFTWHDEERHPLNRPEDNTLHDFMLFFSLEDENAFCDILDRISECYGIPARWIKIDGKSKMFSSTGNVIAKAAFIGYMNRYAWLMKENKEYPEELAAAQAAWDNLYYLSSVYSITTEEALAIRNNPDPFYWAR